MFQWLRICTMNKKQRSTLALIVTMRLMRKRRGPARQRRVWCRQWTPNHDRQGAYLNLVRELQDSDIANVTNFVRMKKWLRHSSRNCSDCQRSEPTV